IIDIKRVKKENNGNSSVKNQPDNQRIQSIKIKPVMFKRPKDKSDNKERRKILKDLRREKRSQKKNLKVAFKTSELMHRQNIYNVQQGITSFQL
ncbi:MAG: hypothetical protein MHPSP_002466, partial [Paramarteilia canceri]